MRIPLKNLSILFTGIFFATGLWLVPACNQSKTESRTGKPDTNQVTDTTQIRVPQFSADTAYEYVSRQVAFGPRVPGTKAHANCAQWIAGQLQKFAGPGNTQVQHTTVQLFNGETVKISNIIAWFNPEARQRILLCAHWDSRMVADHDTENRDKPIDGANDGGSGVAILLETARQLAASPLRDIGVDIVLFDAEDQGTPDNMGYKKDRNSAYTWCLGSQYWSRKRHRPSYNYQYGILLDMAGAENATFYKEGYSMQFAPRIVNMVWAEAHAAGFGRYFPREKAQEVLDDHYFINKTTGIPVIDIIHLNKAAKTFHESWHTHRDNMEIISKETLEAVGQTLLNILYKTDKGRLSV